MKRFVQEPRLRDHYEKKTEEGTSKVAREVYEYKVVVYDLKKKWEHLVKVIADMTERHSKQERNKREYLKITLSALLG